MIEVGELKRLLGKFPDNYLAIVVEDDESSMLGIFTPGNPHNPIGPEPFGYIGMMTWEDAGIFVGDGVESIGEIDTTKEGKP